VQLQTKATSWQTFAVAMAAASDDHAITLTNPLASRGQSEQHPAAPGLLLFQAAASVKPVHVL
jgi:hypothetical protein